MPEAAKVLQFRPRTAYAPLSREAALAEASAYLQLPIESRVDTDAQILGSPDALLSLCNILRDRINSAPSVIAEEAARLYGQILAAESFAGVFDERDFFLGETALIAGTAVRILGKREETERWLDRADANFRHTLNAAANLARVAYARLSLRFETRQYADVLEFLPSVALTFEKAGMGLELAKCRFLEAMALKDLGRDADAMAKFEVLISNGRCEDALRGTAMVNLGNLQGRNEQFARALQSYRAALPLLQKASRPIALADLKAMVGETLMSLGQVDSALQSYREAIDDFGSLAMPRGAAYLRVVLAQALLSAGRSSEAEWEIRCALPTIEAEEMVPEGFAAVAILSESIRQRKADPKALSELRQYLQANN